MNNTDTETLNFCPVPEVRTQFDSVKGVTAGIEVLLPELQSQLNALYWINPSPLHQNNDASSLRG